MRDASRAGAAVEILAFAHLVSNPVIGDTAWWVV